MPYFVPAWLFSSIGMSTMMFASMIVKIARAIESTPTPLPHTVKIAPSGAPIVGPTTGTHHHPPLYTVAESKVLRGALPGGHCKSLLLKDKKDVAVMNEGDTTLPLTDEVCPQCKHHRAFWWTKQMRASDEPETKFLKCEKCKYTWRDKS